MGLFINIDPFLIKIRINKVRDSIRKKKNNPPPDNQKENCQSYFIQIKNKIKNSNTTF